MRILLMRHGESEGNADPRTYLEKGDSNVELTEKGWRQTHGTGIFLRDYYPACGVADWPLIYVSPHQRTLQSLSSALHGMGDLFPDKPRINPQPFLTEKFFGAASALAYIDDTIVPKDFRDNILRLSEAVYKGDPYTAKHLFGESTKDAMVVAKLLMEGTLQRDIKDGNENILIVCHGAVIQNILMNWLHVLPKDKGKIGNPGNGDLIEIQGTPKKWSFTRIWDGQNGIRVSQNYQDKIKRFTVDDLPPVPDFLKPNFS